MHEIFDGPAAFTVQNLQIQRDAFRCRQKPPVAFPVLRRLDIRRPDGAEETRLYCVNYPGTKTRFSWTSVPAAYIGKVIHVFCHRGQMRQILGFTDVHSPTGNPDYFPWIRLPDILHYFLIEDS